MSEIVVVAPVLNRPANAPRLYASLRRSNADARLLFVCSPNDLNQIKACEATGADVLTVGFPPEGGDWARKINTALHETIEPWLLLGADDLDFTPGWDTEALRVAERSGCGVIGTNDQCNAYVKRGLLATHALVARSYALERGTIDEPGKILHEGYWHNWVDAELTETANARGQFAFARRSVIRHLHPLCSDTAMDETYRKALDQRRFEEDRKLLGRRRPLWRMVAREQRAQRKPSHRR